MIVRFAVIACLASAAPLLAACSGDDDASLETTESVTGDDSQAADTDDASSGTADDPDSTAESGDTGSNRPIDGSATDWATVDLTTIDWASIDVSTVDFAAVEENPTIENLDAETVSLIQQRYASEVAGGDGEAGSGEATLTIGAETWEFDDFVCAWGFQNTQSDVFSFTSNAFGTLDDGTRTQLQLTIWDDTGTGALTGPGTEHEVTFDDIDNFEDPAVGWVMRGPEFTFDGAKISAEGEFVDNATRATQQGSFVGECGPGSLF